MDSLRNKFKKLKLERPANTAQDDDLVKELLDYGVNTLSDLEGLFTAEFFAAYDRDHSQSSDYGILRDAMMHTDIKRYFERAWKDRWGSMEPDDFVPLLAKYGSLAKEILMNNEVHVMNLDEGWSE